jgi:tetratricopeptide (TPR) repeat protein/predicted Ser/Thr protein kinase
VNRDDDFLRTGGALGGPLGASLAGDDPRRRLTGHRVGNVRIERWLAAGGMGDVWLGRDERLGRMVAVKTLRADRRLADTVKLRFLREARILSRLDHPSICRLYDLVESDSTDFLLMEYVRGRSLGEVAGTLPLADGLAIALAITDALAAAHREGVIHRDLKPDNVMIAADGSVKVLDFGIARSIPTGGGAQLNVEPHAEPSFEPVAHPHPTTIAATEAAEPDLTEVGAVVGTIRFMSPEQAGGRELTPASDLYSLGVLLHELFTGTSPYPPGSPVETLALVARAATQPPEDLPPPLAALIGDLTALDPESRPSAEDCAERLRWIAAAPQRVRARRRNLALAGLAGIAVAAAAVAGLVAERHRARCLEAAAPLGQVWNPEIAATVESAFSAVDAGATGVAVRRGLDDWAAAWKVMREDACAATRIRGDQSAQLMDLRTACLDDRLGEVASLIEVVLEDPAAARQRAVQAVGGLTALSVCADTRALLSRVPAPADPETEAAVAATRESLSRVKALFDTGRWPDAAAAAPDLVAQADATDYEPIRAESTYLAGLIAERSGRMGDADTLLRQAIWAADAGRMDRVTAQAWIRLVWLHGVILDDVDALPNLSGHARASLRRIGGDSELEGALENHLAVVAAKNGDLDTAFAGFERAIELRTTALGGDHPAVASSLHNLGFVLKDLGRHDEALDLARRAFEIRLQTLGADHPVVLGSLLSLADTYAEQGDDASRRELLDRAVEIAASAFDRPHPTVAALLVHVANAEQDRGRWAEAAAAFTQAREIYAEALGANHELTANALYDEGVSAVRAGDDQRGLEACSQSEQLYLDIVGPHHRFSLWPAHCRITALGRLERFDEALVAAEDAYGRWQASGLDNPALEAGLSLLLARSLDATGRDPERRDTLTEEVGRLIDDGLVTDATTVSHYREWLEELRSPQ